METRKLVVALIALFNAMVTDLEKLMSEDEPASTASSKAKTTGKGVKVKDKDDDNDDDENDDDENDDGDDDEPTADDVTKAVRAALKVLERADVTKLIKKHGKADKSAEVKPAHRKALIEALEEAVDAA